EVFQAGHRQTPRRRALRPAQRRGAAQQRRRKDRIREAEETTARRVGQMDARNGRSARDDGRRPLGSLSVLRQSWEMRLAMDSRKIDLRNWRERRSKKGKKGKEGKKLFFDFFALLAFFASPSIASQSPSQSHLYGLKRIRTAIFIALFLSIV